MRRERTTACACRQPDRAGAPGIYRGRRARPPGDEMGGRTSPRPPPPRRQAPSPQGSSMRRQRSVASAMSIPNRRPAPANSRIWYPVVDANKRSRLPTVSFSRTPRFGIVVDVKALVKSRRDQGLWLEDIEVPKIGINDVLIKVLRTGICGTDVHIYKWDAWAQQTKRPICK